jgi:hypothetical protein
MKLSKAQVSLFWRLWSRACKANGWTTRNGLTAAAVDAHRKDMLSRAGFSSLHDVDRGSGFGRVKAECEALAGSLDGAIELDHPEMDQGRRLLWRLEQDTLCLQLYVGYGNVGYVEGIARALFHLPQDRPVDFASLSVHPTATIDHGTGAEIEGPSPLHQLVMTVHSRLDSLRQIAGHTNHQMRTMAGAKCYCHVCQIPLPTPM